MDLLFHLLTHHWLILAVPWPGIRPATLAFPHDAPTSRASRPGLCFFDGGGVRGDFYLLFLGGPDALKVPLDLGKAARRSGPLSLPPALLSTPCPSLQLLKKPLWLMSLRKRK